MTDEATRSNHPTEIGREISRAMVGLLKDYSGRGPTDAKTYLQENLVVCVLHDTLTKAERSLAGDERTELVEEIRRTFQTTLRAQAIAAVERITGRRVVSFLSDHDVQADYAIEAFVLANGDTS